MFPISRAVKNVLRRIHVIGLRVRGCSSMSYIYEERASAFIRAFI